MPILGAAPMLLTRNVLYTGMTRAKNKLTIIGSSNTIEFMIKNTDSKKRNSGLKFKLEQVL
jgi:exodeoxyribonuclease V alpha subunit